MMRWIAANLRIFLLALALAMAVWAMAVTADDPSQTREYPDPVEIEFVGQDPGLVVNSTLPRQVQVEFQAPLSVWERIDSMEDPVHASVDLSGLDEGEHALEIQIQVDASPVRVVSISPPAMDLVLEPLAKTILPVKLELIGEPAIGYLVGEATLSPVTVSISGAASIIAQVDSVQAQIDLTDLRQDVETSIELQAKDVSGEILNDLTITPGEAEVDMPVIQQGGYRDLAVKVVTRGRLADGYRLTSVSSTPLIVTVYSSDLNLINALPGYVETEALDLTGVSADVETSMNLVLPYGVTLIGLQNVQIQIGIASIEESMMISNRPVEVINLQQDLKAQVSPKVVDVITSGPLPLLNALQPSDVRVLVDVEGRTAGTYQIVPQVEILIDGVTVESILPGTIEIILSELH